MHVISLWEAFNIQRKVVGALLMREVLTRYGRHNVGFLWLFLEPMLFTLGVTFIWTVIRDREKGDLSVIAFILTGYSTVMLWRNAVSSCIRAVGPNMTLLYHSRVAIIDFFIARLILDVLGATMSFIVLGVFFISFGYIPMPNDLLTMINGWFLLIWFSIGLGLIVGSMTEFSEILDRIWHTFTYMMLPLSGVFTLVQWLPEAAREFMLWIPMVHGVEMIRHGYFGDVVNVYYDPLYLVKVNAVMLIMGLLLTRSLKYKVIP
jgi:capsular polysaccharide transport system permease protein